MSHSLPRCSDCDSNVPSVTRRKFLQASAAVGAVAATGGIYPVWSRAEEAAATSGAAETSAAKLFGILSDEQKQEICFAWDHMDPKRGLLRTRVANNWHITEPVINSDFFTDDQRDLIREVYQGILHPDWHARIDRQLEDDAGGYGNDQNIAIFGQPGGPFEFVMTGRHLTIRCDGNSAEHLAFGGPIFYGHAPQDNEEPGHPGNVFWEQGAAANRVFEMLDGKQRAVALVKNLPNEQAVSFRGEQGQFPGLAVSEMSSDQQGEVEKVLTKLLEPYRQADRDEVAACLKGFGGLERCALAFYQDGDIGDDKVWDCWRLEGPSFVWYFRGSPHVHVWANVASSPDVKLNA